MIFKSKLVILVILAIVLTVSGCSDDTLYKVEREVSSGRGVIELEPNQDDYEAGTEVKVAALAEKGYQFEKWAAGLSQKENFETKIIIEQDLYLIAEFERIGIAGEVEFAYDIDYSDRVNFTTSSVSTTAKSEEEKIIVGEKLVKFQEGVSKAQREAVINNLGAEIIKSIDNLNLVLIRLDTDKEISASEYKEIEYIESNYRVEVNNDYTFSTSDIHQNWNHKQINLVHLTENAESKAIAVLDTGVDYEHKDLKDLVNKDAGKNFTDDDFNDVNGHGTHVAGIAGLTGSEIIPVKVMGDNGSGDLYDLIAGIDYVTEQGVADVINLSLGFYNHEPSDYDPLEEAINNAYQAGIKLVAATGNEGEADVAYPAKYENVIAIGSVDYSGNKADHSNYGTDLDFMAPGKFIYSTYPDNKYEYLAGTSMATPHVASFVALLLGQGVPQSEIRNRLAKTAMDIGSSTEYGKGLVNAYWAENNVEEIKILIGNLTAEGSEIDAIKETTISVNQTGFLLEDVESEEEYRVFAWVDTKGNQIIESGDYFAQTEKIDFTDGEEYPEIKLILQEVD